MWLTSLRAALFWKFAHARWMARATHGSRVRSAGASGRPPHPAGSRNSVACSTGGTPWTPSG
eukprot:1126453-Lingulodinium_polyedra.AAC.1